MKSTYIIGSRGSQLALIQANWVKDALQKQHPDCTFEIQIIKTEGDLGNVHVLGAFVKEIQLALIDHRIDIAVHSMKDLPVELSQDLKLGAITEREDVRDILISKHHSTLQDLPEKAIIGTGSPRREMQLKMLRPDIQVEFINGNVNTRIQKMQEGKYDALILAYAGIKRLEMQNQITQYFDLEEILPAVGQGALGIEIRRLDEETESIVKCIDHKTSRISVMAERVILEKLGGGCNKPLAAYAKIEGDTIIIDAIYSDGVQVIQQVEEGLVEDANLLAESVAVKLLEHAY